MEQIEFNFNGDPGARADRRLIGICKGPGCWFHKTEKCRFFADHEIKSGDLCRKRLYELRGMGQLSNPDFT